jgi:MATE family multidrug resistance protein
MNQNTNTSEPAMASPRHPLLEVWTQAWPIIITMTSYTVMQFVDKLMVGQVGPLELAAQGNGGIWAFTPMAFAMGAMVVVNTWVSQHMGAGNSNRVARYLWGALYISIAVWLVILLPWALLLPWFFSAVVHSSHDVEQLDRLIELESAYGQILLLGGFFQIAGRGIHQFFFGIMRPKVVTVAVIIGNVVNVVMNYILIFGEEGLSLPMIDLPGVPGVTAMGVHGAALGTVCGMFVEVLIPFIVFLGPRCHREFNSRSTWKPEGESMRDLIRLGWPGSLVSGNEIVCWSIFMTMLVGLFGSDSMTAGWIVLGYMHLGFMPAVAISFAINTLVGNSIGAGDKDLAVRRTRWGVGLGVVYMSCCGLAFILFREPMVAIFIGSDATPEQAEAILAIGIKLMIVAALFQTVDAIGICYSGALRGAGDVIWPGVFLAICGWAFIIGGGWVMADQVPQLGAVGPWIGAAIYIIVTGIGLWWRFECGRWRSIELVDPAAK